MSPRLLPAFLLSALLPLATCATANPNAAKYPPRPAGCRVRVYHSAVPEVKEWDDLGIAQVDCELDVGAVQCLGRLRARACRMGGDIVYDVPKKPMRPTDQGMYYVGRVGHTREAPGTPDKDDPGGAKPDDGSGQSTPAESGPVEPLPSAGASASRSEPDGGAR